MVEAIETTTQSPTGSGSTTSRSTGMQITVVTPEGKKVVIDVSPSDTIDDVKKKVQELTGIPPEQQNLGRNGQNLDGKAILSEAGLKDGSTITMSATTTTS